MSTPGVPLLPQEELITAEPASPLLTLVDGVENILLSFVATGTGGLKGLLNLRAVCKATKSWVDKLPGPQGVSAFSRAEVHLDSDVGTLRRFLESAPPFAVTSLSLITNSIKEDSEEFDLRVKGLAALHLQDYDEEEEEGDEDYDEEEDKLWDRFSAFWVPRLETLQLRIEGNRPAMLNMGGDGDMEDGEQKRYIKHINRKTLKLLEGPNLRNVTTDQQEPKALFYSKFKKNRNLKRVEISFVFASANEAECLGKVIDAKKDFKELDVRLGMIEFPPTSRLSLELFTLFTASFVNLSNILVNSKSKIRLRLRCSSDADCLQMARTLLGDKMFWEFANRVESIHSWKPTEDSLALLRSLSKLERLEDLEIDAPFLEELIFPPNLVELGLNLGFPKVQGLPSILTSLKLSNVSSCADGLVRSLHRLNEHCPSLEKLYINWWCVVCVPSCPKKTTGSEKILQKLRTLTLTGLINHGEEGCCRDVLLNGFQMDDLQLSYLMMRFKMRPIYLLSMLDMNMINSNTAEWPIVDEEVLTRLCDGAVGSSLLTVNISDKSVTPNGKLLFEKFKSSVSANRKRRLEREGRGAWQRRHRMELSKYLPPMPICDINF